MRNKPRSSAREQVDMKRRGFLQLAALGSAAALSACTGTEPGEISRGAFSPVGENGLLAGLSLAQMRERYRSDLFDHFLPFMERYVIDRLHGGLLYRVDVDGSLLGPEKRARMEGRGAWVYSFLYRTLTREERHLEIAHDSVRFILENELSACLAADPDELAFWPYEFSREGRPLHQSQRRVPFDARSSTYEDLYVALGLAGFAAASGETRYWNLAKGIVLKCLRHYERPDFFPGAARLYLGEEAPDVPGARILGVWMVLLEICLEMLEFKKDPDLEELSTRAVDAVWNRHLHPEFDLFCEITAYGGLDPEERISQYVNISHSTKILWAILRQAERLKNRSLFERAAKAFRRHFQVAWDRVYGGLRHSLVHVDENRWNLTKSCHIQEGALLATLNLIEHAGSRWAEKAFSQTFKFVHAHYPVVRNQELLLWIDSADRKVTLASRSRRAEIFQHPRHLMFNLLSLERILERRGATSDVFS